MVWDELWKLKSEELEMMKESFNLQMFLIAQAQLIMLVQRHFDSLLFLLFHLIQLIVLKN